MKFTICIPNYNYERYLGETIESVLRQTWTDYELVIADNKSTDRSVKIIENFAQKHFNINYQVNPTNLGFSGNLDRAASMSKGDYMIMLSSDDVIQPIALSKYLQLLDTVTNRSVAISSSWDIIDAAGKKIGRTGPDPEVWPTECHDQKLSDLFGFKVYRQSAATLLRRCLLANKTPFNFCTTCYPREAYNQIGGYGQSRMINPDKWFHWRLLGVLEEAFFLDLELFQYRWHDSNQTSQQKSSGHLKYVTDEYRSTIEISEDLLQKAGVSLKTYHQTFIDRVILRHGLGELSKGLWLKSFRILHFGWAAYPLLMLRRFPQVLVYGLLLLIGPLGGRLLKLFYRARRS